MIAIVDYGFGNLRSVSKALSLLSIDSKITDSKNVIEDSESIIFPGVGSFGDCIKNLEEKFVLNSLGIREPCGINLKTISSNKIDAVVTPGLAFDSSGCRIGFGGGYYDKLFLELTDKSLRIGVAYDFQRVESLYQDPWDKKVEKVITEKNMLCG